MRRALVAAGLVVVLAGGAAALVSSRSTSDAAAPDAPVPSVETAALVDGVVQRAVAKIDPVRLTNGVVPPTNRWYSGLVFGPEPQPVFAEPLSFALTETGFTLGLPD